MAVAHSSRLSYDDSVTCGPWCARPTGNPLGAFGDKFRTERERRGFTLDDVSNVTKINARMLKAIEDEHFDRLPGGVFNKGFVRAYAKHLGFNDEESVNEYLAALRQAQVQAQTASWQPDAPPPVPERGRPGQNRLEARNEDRRSEAQRNEDQRAQQIRAVQLQAEQIRTERIRGEEITGEEIRAEQIRAERIRAEKERPEPKLAPPAGKVDPNLAATSEIKLAGQTKAQRNVALNAQHKYPPADLTPGSIVPPRDSIPWKVPAVALAVILVAALLWNRHSRGVRAEVVTSARPSAAATNSTPGNVAPTTARNAITPPSGSSNPTPSNAQPVINRTLASNPATAAAATDRSFSDPGVMVRKPAAPAAAASTLPLFTLRIRASETSWILVIADGQPVLHENLIAPASTSVRAAREVTVRVGNAAGVSFLLNGKEIPPQGAEAEVKTVTFDSQGLKEAFGSPSPKQIH
jgi:hypothetical protein